MFGENNATHLFAMLLLHSLLLGVNEPLHLGMMKLQLETLGNSAHGFQSQGGCTFIAYALFSLVPNDPQSQLC